MRSIGKFLNALRLTRKKGQKTDVWLIYSTKEAFLGRVSWYGPWRQYVFEPTSGTVFNRQCLEDIAAFLKAEMDRRK